MTGGCLGHFCRNEQTREEFTDGLSHTWRVQTERRGWVSSVKVFLLTDALYLNFECFTNSLKSHVTFMWYAPIRIRPFFKGKCDVQKGSMFEIMSQSQRLSGHKWESTKASFQLHTQETKVSAYCLLADVFVHLNQTTQQMSKLPTTSYMVMCLKEETPA